MQRTDAIAFAQGLGLLAEAFNEPLSDARTEAYFSALEDLDRDAVLGAMRLSLRSSRFFPKPADLREFAAGGSKQDRADLAWGELIKAVKRFGWAWKSPGFDDPLLMPTIQAVWGSWVGLCETLPADGPELVGWMKQFKSTYGSVTGRVENPLGRLPEGLRHSLEAIIEQKRLQ